MPPRARAKETVPDEEIIEVDDKLETLFAAFTDGLTSEEKMDLDEWSDKYRVLPSETSSEFGQWRTDRFPFLRRIMKCLSPSSRAREVVGIKGAQLGFTELFINWILYTADHDPGPMMYVQKTKEAAEDFSTQKLVPSIEACDRVKKTLGTSKPKHLTNTVGNKGFPGGYCVIGGANSGPFLRSKSIGRAGADEEDSFPANVDNEGSPIYMIRKRLSNFPFSKFFRLSTPKIKETSTIEPGYMKGSQEQYYVPCPHCNPEATKAGTWWTIKWGNIRWNKDKDGKPILDSDGVPTGIGLVCESCGAIVDEAKKTWMLSFERWMSTKNLDGGDEEVEPYEVGDVEFPSFHINSLYSPYGFFSWRDAVIEWFEYKNTGDKTLLQGFINQTLGETYSVAGSDISSTWLYNRREEYDIEKKGFDIPEGGLVVTAGVDIQGDRIEVETVAWGLNMESWSLDYQVFFGSTDSLGDVNGLDSVGSPTVWRMLDEFLLKQYKHESGAILNIESTQIDAGYMAEIVHVFCKNREHRRIFPLKGFAGWGRGFFEKPKNRHTEFKTWDFKAYVDELKELTYNLLMVDVAGAGYCHFPIKDMYSEKYFHMLTAENKVVEASKKLKWVCPKGVRNEALDLRNYATVAFKIYAVNLELRAQKAHPLFAGVGSTAPSWAEGGAPPQAQQAYPIRKKRRGSRGI